MSNPPRMLMPHPDGMPSQVGRLPRGKAKRRAIPRQALSVGAPDRRLSAQQICKAWDSIFGQVNWNKVAAESEGMAVLVYQEVFRSMVYGAVESAMTSGSTAPSVENNFHLETIKSSGTLTSEECLLLDAPPLGHLPDLELQDMALDAVDDTEAESEMEANDPVNCVAMDSSADEVDGTVNDSEASENEVSGNEAYEEWGI